MVTDLDKNPETAAALTHEGVPVAAHAHGDNIPAVREWLPGSPTRRRWRRRRRPRWPDPKSWRVHRRRPRRLPRGPRRRWSPVFRGVGLRRPGRGPDEGAETRLGRPAAAVAGTAPQRAVRFSTGVAGTGRRARSDSPRPRRRDLKRERGSATRRDFGNSSARSRGVEPLDQLDELVACGSSNRRSAFSGVTSVGSPNARSRSYRPRRSRCERRGPPRPTRRGGRVRRRERLPVGPS